MYFSISIPSNRIRRLLTLSLLSLLLCSGVSSQDTDFYGDTISADPCDEFSHDTNVEVEELMKRIMETLGMQRNPYKMQPCSTRPNCSATIKRGQEYILYNPDYLGKIKTLQFSNSEAPKDALDWSVVGVLAHEVGHHFNGHLKNSKLSSHEMELEADYQAGFILYMLGATDFQAASSCLRNVAEESSGTHPGRNDRVISFSKGWQKAQNKVGLTPKGESTIKDNDGDGIPDHTDLCPNEFGDKNTNGCPDSDGDGVPNRLDQCPFAFGKANWAGCPDSDNDGVPDHEDKCPEQVGGVLSFGCPDRDNDGVPDTEDACPDRPGLAVDKGCPKLADLDGDGVPDVSDRCRTVFGLTNLQGCPDKDGDGIPDIDDKCPDEKGSHLREGCPMDTEEIFRDPLVGKFVLVKGGTFKMGCTLEQSGCESDEFPSHSITLSDYFIGEAEVTQSLWKTVMGGLPPQVNPCDDCPIEMVSWNDVQQFIRLLNSKSAVQYRLPTEAEWEYAARGGSKSKGYKFSGSNSFNDVGWFSGNSGGSPKPVKGKKANELGLYDMSGNIWEWCSDVFETYPKTDKIIQEISPNSFRVCRGGAWNYPINCGRVSDRNLDDPDMQFQYIGFRLAREK